MFDLCYLGSSRQSNSAIYANVGGNDYIYGDGVRSTDSQGSATEDELLGLVAGSPSLRGQGPSYYTSPPSPVSSRFENFDQKNQQKLTF